MIQQRRRIARLTMLYRINNHVSAAGLKRGLPPPPPRQDAATAFSSHSSSVALSTVGTRSCPEPSGNGTTFQLQSWRPAQSTLLCQGPSDRHSTARFFFEECSRRLVLVVDCSSRSRVGLLLLFFCICFVFGLTLPYAGLGLSSLWHTALLATMKK